MKLQSMLIGAAVVFYGGQLRAQTQADVVFVGVQSIGGATLKERPGEVEQRSFMVVANPHPIRLSGSTMLSVGATVNHTLVDLDRGAAFPGEPPQRNLMAIDTRVGLIHILNDRWVLTEGVTPGIRSDLTRPIGTDDMQLAGYVMASYLLNAYPRITLQFGFVAQTHATVTPLLPIVSIGYLSDHFIVEVGASGLNAIARIGSRLEAGVFGSFDSSWYRIQPAEAGVTRDATFLWLTNITVGPQVNFRPFGDVWIDTRAGYTIARILKLGDSERNTLDALAFQPNGGLMVQVGVSYGARPPKG